MLSDKPTETTKFCYLHLIAFYSFWSVCVWTELKFSHSADFGHSQFGFALSFFFFLLWRITKWLHENRIFHQIVSVEYKYEFGFYSGRSLWPKISLLLLFLCASDCAGCCSRCFLTEKIEFSTRERFSYCVRSNTLRTASMRNEKKNIQTWKDIIQEHIIHADTESQM